MEVVKNLSLFRLSASSLPAATAGPHPILVKTDSGEPARKRSLVNLPSKSALDLTTSSSSPPVAYRPSGRTRKLSVFHGQQGAIGQDDRRQLVTQQEEE